ncbi:MAG: hypothetical protein ACYC3W_12160, partial [Candidatus Nanopelagicales bacterium]
EFPIKQPYFTQGTWYALNCRWVHPEIDSDLIFKALKAEGVRVNRPSGWLHNEPIFYEQALIPHRTAFSSKQPALNFPNTVSLFNSIIGFDTREFYEPADDILKLYSNAFKKIGQNLHTLVLL